MRNAHLSSIGGYLRAGALAGLPLLILGQACLVNAAGEGDDPDPTAIAEVVMYGVDDNTHELLRYSFRSNEYIVIGQIQDESGNIVNEIESLGFIPSGPHKGLYGVTNYDGSTSSPPRTEASTASATATATVTVTATATAPRRSRSVTFRPVIPITATRSSSASRPFRPTSLTGTSRTPATPRGRFPTGT
jgi:hypothetical protein